MCCLDECSSTYGRTLKPLPDVTRDIPTYMCFNVNVPECGAGWLKSRMIFALVWPWSLWYVIANEIVMGCASYFNLCFVLVSLSSKCFFAPVFGHLCNNGIGITTQREGVPSDCTQSAVSILLDAFSADASTLGTWTFTVSGTGTIISAPGTEPASRHC